MDSGHYETPAHGLFPRYVVAALLVALVGGVLPSGVFVLLEVIDKASVPSFEALLPVVGLLYFPLVPFLVFYLVTRVRIDLGGHYAAVALSLAVGASAGALPIYLMEDFISLSAGSPLGFLTLLQGVGYALDSGLEIAFVGFVAVLYSYYRRM